MKLKVKNSGWSAGRPVAILNESATKKIGVKVNDRILIRSKTSRVISILDISSKIAHENEIVLSSEIIDYMKLKNNEFVEVEIAKNPQIIQIIHKKFANQKLSEKEIFTIIESIVNNALTETEIAFFISAVYEAGMSLDEIAWMTKAMVNTGDKLHLKNKIIIDKHSIGGIAGNRTTPIVVSICAAAGLIFPKTSSRAITSAAGTADVVETICRVNFSARELEKIINRVGACLAWGGSLGFAPADDKIIRVESQINIDPEPNLLASILAKKLAVGSKYILIDIPYGKFAKVDKKQALHLKKQFESLGKLFKLHLKCEITKGEAPIGNGIGPVLEMRDIILVLNNNGPEDLKNKALFLSGQLFELAGKTKKGQGQKLAREILESGKALKKFNEIISTQGGNIKNINKTLSLAKLSLNINSKSSGKIKEIDNKKINLLARIAGSPNDKKAGIYLHKHLGDKVSKGEKLITIYSQSNKRLQDAKDFCDGNHIFVMS